MSPATARQMVESYCTVDVRHLLPAVTTPTLVVHRVGETWLSVEHGRYLAAHTPDARYAELPGADHWPWFGDSDAVLQAVEPFLDGLP